MHHHRRSILRRKHLGMRLHLVHRVPLMVLLRRVRRNMAAHRRRVAHIRWGRTHVGRRRVIRNLLLSSRGHGWLPMGHCGQMMVHHV